MNDTGHTFPHLWLARFAKLVVAATFVLIFIGGHTTTSGAGMAFPDWPLSHGSLNPSGWWANLFERLEHGHRLTAETVGLLVGILCAWVWQRQWALPLSAGVSIVLAGIAKVTGVTGPIVAHIGLWSAALTFAVALFFGKKRADGHPAAVRWLAFAAFLGVLAQAVAGGLRVTIESGGDPQLAVAFRIFHGCFAQLELALLVALAAMLSPAWPRIRWSPAFPKIARLAWIAVGVIFLQLLVGATMRHMGAGLAIQTFPTANPDGGFMPHAHSAPVDLNFTHTRFGALLVTIFVVAAAIRSLRGASGESRIIVPAVLLLGLLALQVTLGVMTIWAWSGSNPDGAQFATAVAGVAATLTGQRVPHEVAVLLIRTAHVLNGAALVATTVLLAVRATWTRALSTTQFAPAAALEEARA